MATADGPQFDAGQVAPTDLDPDPLATAVLRHLRYRDLKSISDRMGRMSRFGWGRFFHGAFLLLLGAVLGGVFGLIPFLSSEDKPSTVAKLVYFGLLGASVVIALVIGVSSLAIKSQHDDSVAAIKKELDDLLKAYEAALEAASGDRRTPS